MKKKVILVDANCDEDGFYRILSSSSASSEDDYFDDNFKKDTPKNKKIKQPPRAKSVKSLKIKTEKKKTGEKRGRGRPASINHKPEKSVKPNKRSRTPTHTSNSISASKAPKQKKSNKFVEITPKTDKFYPFAHPLPSSLFSEQRFLSDPLENPCTFVNYDLLKPNIFSPQFFIPHSEQGVNTFIPGFPEEGKRLIDSLNLDLTPAKFKFRDIGLLSDEDLVSEIELCESKIDFSFKHAHKIISSFNPYLKNSICIHANVLNYNWKALGSFVKFDVILMDPPCPCTLR